jgi:hypothetical protein
MVNNYQIKFLKKALTEEEFLELDRKYSDITARHAHLIPATKEEKEILKRYLTQKMTLKEVSKALNIPQGSTGNKIRTLALKVLAEKYKSLDRANKRNKK